MVLDPIVGSDWIDPTYSTPQAVLAFPYIMMGIALFTDGNVAFRDSSRTARRLGMIIPSGWYNTAERSVVERGRCISSFDIYERSRSR